MFAWAVPAASHLPELLKATFDTLRSTGGFCEAMKTIQAQRKIAHNETAATTGLRAISANVKGSKTANGTPVILYSCGGQPNEQWNYKPDGQLYGLGNKCLTSSGLTAGSLVSLTTCIDSAEQVWSVVNGPQLGFAAGNHLLLVAAGPPTLCLDAGGGSSGTQLVVNSCTGAASQKWILR